MRPGKYMWVPLSFDNWVKQQQKILHKKVGVKTSTVDVVNLLEQKVIIPNNIQMKDVFKEKVKLKKNWKKNVI